MSYRVDISALRTSVIDIKYLGWFANHRHLFDTSPSAYMVRLSGFPPGLINTENHATQPPAAVVNITVHANGVEGGDVDIQRVPYDATLRQSLISIEYAQATHGTIVQTGAEVTLHAGGGKSYTSASYITLKWWLWDETVSYRDNFYITEDLPRGCNAMLHRMPEDGHPSNKALPLFNKGQTAGKLLSLAQRRVYVFD